MKSRKNSAKWMLFLGLPALLVLAFGCGLDRAPVAQEEEELASAPEGGVLLAFSPQAVRRAAKMAGEPVAGEEEEGGSLTQRTKVGIVGPAGGTLTVEDRSGGRNSGIIANFTVPQGALDRDCKIVMTVHGEALSEMVVEFSPGGLEFYPDATLELVLGSERIDLDIETLPLWHVHGDGTVEKANIRERRQGANGALVLIVDIPGFSRYGVYWSK